MHIYQERLFPKGQLNVCYGYRQKVDALLTKYAWHSSTLLGDHVDNTEALQLLL